MGSTTRLRTPFLLVGGPLFVVVVGGVSLFVWKQICFASLPAAQKHAVESLSGIGPRRVWEAGASVEYDLGRRLVAVNLLRSRVADEDLAALQALDSIEWLNLQQTRISDAGFVHVEPLSSLKSLGLSDTLITDAGLGRVAKLEQLERLFLNDTRINDAGLSHIATLPRLEELYLRRTRITDEGLSTLGSLTSLRILAVSDTGVTEEGIDRFRRHLPACKIYR